MSTYRSRPDLRILSQPINLEWLGWRTTTAELGYCGWDLSADENYNRNTMMIAARRVIEGRTVQLITELERYHYDRMLRERRPVTLPVFSVQMAEGLCVRSNIRMEAVDFHSVDPRPVYHNQEIKRVEDLAHFKRISNPSKEIILQQASLDEVLNFALKKQSPRQDEIREEMMRRREIDNYRMNSDPHTELRLAV